MQIKPTKKNLLLVFSISFFLLGCSSTSTKNEVVYSYDNSITIKNNHLIVTPEVINLATDHCNKFSKVTEFISSHPAKNTKNKVFHLFNCKTEKMILAEQGDIHAQYEIALIFQEGLGIKKNTHEAVKWYKEAAKQGHPEASFNLGIIYYKGKGLLQDKTEALKWYRKSAEQGHDKSQINLGHFYANEKGDFVKAYLWTLMAIKQQDGTDKIKLAAFQNTDDVSLEIMESILEKNRKKANKNLQIYIKNMTKEQMNIARDLADKCWEARFKDCENTQSTITSQAKNFAKNPEHKGMQNIQLTTSWGGEIEYSLPSGWCNITKTKIGLKLLKYTRDNSKRNANNSNSLGPDIKLIIKKCNSTNEKYPFGYVGLIESDKTQISFNKEFKELLQGGYLNRLPGLNKTKILKDDENQVTFYKKTGYDFILTSMTVLENTTITTYIYNDEIPVNSNSDIINAVVSNAEKLKQLNHFKKQDKTL